MANQLLRWFEVEHLPEDLAEIVQECRGLAEAMAENLPECAETSEGIRKLLEAKDCFVRAAIIRREKAEAAGP